MTPSYLNARITVAAPTTATRGALHASLRETPAGVRPHGPLNPVLFNRRRY